MTDLDRFILSVMTAVTMVLDLKLKLKLNLRMLTMGCLGVGYWR
jgi:hypothetical protein